jgi:murein DD-endopeptidase MepM/ murein hydrolase activator NlpD
MAAIAAQNGVLLSALIAANPQVANPNRIYPGDNLHIPAATGGNKGGAGASVAASAASSAAAATPNPAANAGNYTLGSVSERYESSGRGPGTVSTGNGDPGGVSYGVYQLSSNKGTLNRFMAAEGSRWANEFRGMTPGSREYNAQWRAIASREPAAFRAAQHDFIERTHYQPALARVSEQSGIDLNSRHNAVREAAWSVSVQHGRAALILNRAVAATDAQMSRSSPDYDRALAANIYAQRTAYVLEVARNTRDPDQRAQLVSITRNRYPAELRDVQALFNAPAGQNAATPTPSGNVTATSPNVTGNGPLSRWPVSNPQLNRADRAGEGDGHYGTHRSRGRHGGIDLVGREGDPIMAAGAGRVVDIQPNPSSTYGYQVVIDHGNGVFTQYAHLQRGSITVRPGDTVEAGDPIARMGRTGNTPSGGDTHLHFEVRLGSSRPAAAGGRTVDPLQYLGNIPR